MTDLELLELLEKAQQRNTGPQGEPGVGIDRIEQFDPQSVTFVLSSGATRKVNLPAPTKGDPGEVGPAGARGEPGRDGRAGRAGADGLQGQRGVAGQDGSSVDSAIVNVNGDLLIGLSDGTIITAGRVVGPAGATGRSGDVGLRGESGVDGTSCIAEFRPPSQDDGKEGDSYIDCSSAEFAFYKRSGNGWSKIANLRQPARDPRMGVAGGGAGTGTGGGGSGGGAEVHVGPEAPAFPSVGDLWYDTNDADGRMYVYDGGDWQPVLPQPDLDGYAKTTYVDVKTAPLPYRIETDKVLRDGKLRSSTAEIQLVDNENNFTNVKFTGLNGIGVTSDQQGITFDGAALLGDITVELDDYATKTYSDAADQNLQNQIDDLSVSRGKVARYEVKNVAGTPVSRPGEMSTNNPFWSNVIAVSFGIEDLDGAVTKPIAVGDIIDFVDSDTEKLSRYKVTDSAGAPTGVGVEYVSGDAGFGANEIKQVYIYPQNEAGASKEYVDAQDALLFPIAGGTITGTVSFKRGSKPNNQFKISPNSGEDYATNIYGLNNGPVRFRTSHTNNEGQNVGSHIILSPNDGVPTTAIYHLIEPTHDDMPATRKYVDENAGGNAKIPVVSGTPPGVTVGSMWYDTGTASMYIKVS